MSSQEHMSNLGFRGLGLWLKWRERSTDPEERLRRSGVRPGQTVLDYGCGVGSYAIPAARMVGDEGVVYALDIHPLASEAVEKRARKAGLGNVRTITSGLDTGLPVASVDVALLYDVFHAVNDRDGLVVELCRVLKTGGRVSVLPDHMTTDELVAEFTAGGRFVPDGAPSSAQFETVEFIKAGKVDLEHRGV